jgi:hypothetical protein
MKKIMAMATLAIMLGGCAATAEMLVDIANSMPAGGNQGASSYPGTQGPTYPVRTNTGVSANGVR